MTTQTTASASRHSIYTGRTTSWPMVATTGLGALFVVLMSKQADAAWSDLYFMVPMLLVAVGSLANVLTASSVRTTAGPNGFTIRWGLLGWPKCTYHLDQIEHAEVINLPWWRVSYGFWWTPRRTNCTVRNGPTVRLSLHNERIITITVPNPSAAVAALHEASPDTQPNSA